LYLPIVKQLWQLPNTQNSSKELAT
jgi:hypothetical protein